MIEIHMQGCDVNLITNPVTGLRTMRFVDPESGIRFRVDCEEDAAKALGGGLIGSSIEIASEIPSPPAVQH